MTCQEVVLAANRDDAQANKIKVQAYHEKVRGFEEMYRENLRKTEADNDELSKEVCCVRIPAS